MPPDSRETSDRPTSRPTGSPPAACWRPGQRSISTVRNSQLPAIRRAGACARARHSARSNVVWSSRSADTSGRCQYPDGSRTPRSHRDTSFRLTVGVPAASHSRCARPACDRPARSRPAAMSAPGVGPIRPGASIIGWIAMVHSFVHRRRSRFRSWRPSWKAASGSWPTGTTVFRTLVRMAPSDGPSPWAPTAVESTASPDARREAHDRDAVRPHRSTGRSTGRCATATVVVGRDLRLPRPRPESGRLRSGSAMPHVWRDVALSLSPVSRARARRRLHVRRRGAAAGHTGRPGCPR
jgi:hypothetical protein